MIYLSLFTARRRDVFVLGAHVLSLSQIVLVKSKRGSTFRRPPRVLRATLGSAVCSILRAFQRATASGLCWRSCFRSACVSARTCQHSSPMAPVSQGARH